MNSMLVPIHVDDFQLDANDLSHFEFLVLKLLVLKNYDNVRFEFKTWRVNAVFKLNKFSSTDYIHQMPCRAIFKYANQHDRNDKKIFYVLNPFDMNFGKYIIIRVYIYMHEIFVHTCTCAQGPSPF